MLVDFFGHLKGAGLPVSLREFLDLLGALEARVVSCSVGDFYGLSRACLVKDERLYDRFDLAFGSFFDGLELAGEALLEAEIPEAWLREQLRKQLSEEERAALDELGFDELLDWLKLLLAEDIPLELLRAKNAKTAIPPLHGALLKNEQDVYLFERLVFLDRGAGQQ